MNLETMLARAQEIEGAIVNTTNQLNALFGHKNETQHWIAKLREAESSTQVEEPLASSEEVPVQ